MTRLNVRALVIAAGLGVCSLTSAPVARAQENTKQDVEAKRVSLNLENADIKYALKLLFQSVGADYSLDPNVQGSVTVSLTDVPFRTALETVLKTTSTTLPVTYRKEGGIYNIAVKVVDPGEGKTGTDETPETPVEPKKKTIKLQINFADAIDIAEALGGSVITTRLGSIGNQGGGGFGGGMGGGMGGMGGGMGGMGGGMGGMGGGMGGFGGGGMGGGGFGGGGLGGGGFGGGGLGGGMGGGGFGGGRGGR